MSAATASPGAATARNEIIDVILGIVLTDQPDDFRTAAAIVDLASASMFFSSCVLRKISSHKKKRTPQIQPDQRCSYQL